MNRLARDNGLRAPKWVPNDVVKKQYVEAFIYDEYAYGGVYSPESAAVAQEFVFKGLESAFDLARHFEKERERKQMDEILESFRLKAEGVSLDVVKSDVLGLNPGGISVEEFKRDVLGEPIYDEWDGRIDRIDQLSRPGWWTRLARYFGFW